MRPSNSMPMTGMAGSQGELICDYTAAQTYLWLHSIKINAIVFITTAQEVSLY
jgi:hypothetical protein